MNEVVAIGRALYARPKRTRHGGAFRFTDATERDLLNLSAGSMASPETNVESHCFY